MASYVDGYVIPIPKKGLAAYRKLAKIGAKLWHEHGALHYFECVGDDLTPKCGLPFPKALKIKPSETVVFSFIVFKSRKHRDSVNTRVMADPRLTAGLNRKKMPFDVKKMSYGGFETIVEA